MALAELVASEEEFVGDLDAAVRLFVTPALDGCVLASDDAARLFGTLPALVEVNRALLADLDDDSCSVGEAFTRAADALKQNAGCCVGLGKDRAKLLRKLDKHNAAFHTLLQDARKDPAAKQRDLGAFLELPASRVQQYPALLQAVLVETEDDDPEKAALEKAVESMRGVLAVVEEKRSELKTTKRLAKLQKRMVDERGQPFELVRPGRKLLREGDVNEKQAAWSRSDGLRWNTSSRVAHYLLFNDVLLRVTGNKKLTVKSRTPIAMLECASLSTPEECSALQLDAQAAIELKLAPVEGIPVAVAVWFDDDSECGAWLQAFEAAKEAALQAAIGSVVQAVNKK